MTPQCFRRECSIPDRVPTVTVAIPTLGADDSLVECLESLRQQNFSDFEVVVVDNSGRGLVKLMGAATLGVARVMEMSCNVGFGAAINAAWEGSGARYLATLNDDAVAAAGWLSALVSTAERRPEAGMFASRVMLEDDSLDSAGMLLCADGSSKQRGHGEAPERFAQEEEVLLPSASAALYRGEMLRQVGAFDGDFFLYCEDTDLGLRARRAGWTSVYVPSAVVRHRYSHSAGRVSALKAYYVERNRLFVAVKNFPAALLPYLPFAAALRYLWHVIFMVQGKGAAAHFATESNAGWRLPVLVLRAHMGLLRNLPRLLKQRRKIQASARVANPAFCKVLRRYSLSPRKIASY